jgi:hypothetical protein
LTVRKRGGHWYFDFQIRGARYREAIPGARTKFQAEQVEAKAHDQVFQGTYGSSQLGNQDFSEFVSETYLPWAKANKRTWHNDEIIANQWAEYSGARRCVKSHPWQLKSGNVIVLSPLPGAAQLAVRHL